jgi:dCMP deaminase
MLRTTLFNETFMQMAVTIANLSTCPRAHVGAILVRDRRVLSVGYNGAPIGTPHCDDIGCYLEGSHCVRSVHAEQNVIVQAALHGVSTEGASLYCTHRPCLSCTRILINARIKTIFFLNEYDSGTFSVSLLKNADIFIKCLKEEPSQESVKILALDTLTRGRNFVTPYP